MAVRGARRGKFGQMPTAQPNLDSTLASIAHEMQSQNDSDIMDAWRNGGEYQGQKVTDEMVLQYWKDRMQHLDPNDPLYDKYQEQVEQLQYGVEQSKMDLLHVQGKLSDQAYAQFFIGWAKKVPANSEFWRTLQKDAAQLIQQTKVNGAARADQKRREAYNAFLQDQYKQTAIGTSLMNHLQDLASKPELNLNIHNDGDQLLSILAADYNNHPDAYTDLTDAMQAVGIQVPYGGSYSSLINSGFLTEWLSAAQTGYGVIAARALKEGDSSTYSSATKTQAAATLAGTDVATWNIEKAYDAGYRQFSAVWGDPSASWADKQAAANTFATLCTKLEQTPGISEWAKTDLHNDSLRLTGHAAEAGDGNSFGATLGTQSSNASGTGDYTPGVTVDMGNKITNQMALQNEMNLGAGSNDATGKWHPTYVLAPVDKDGNFDPTGQGGIGIVPSASLPANTTTVAAIGRDGNPTSVTVAKHTIYEDNPGSDPIPVGETATYTYGGKSVVLYNVGGGWTADKTSVWQDGVSEDYDKNGDMHVRQTKSADPASVAARIDQANGTHISFSKPQYGIAADYNPGNGMTSVHWDGTKFTVTTYGAGGGTGNKVEVPVGGNIDPRQPLKTIVSNAYSAGVVPTADSAADASVALLPQPALKTLLTDPNFRKNWVDEQLALFGTADEMDPRIVAKWSGLVTTATQPMSYFPTKSWTPLSDGGYSVAGITTPQTEPIPAASKEGLDYPGKPTEAPKAAQPVINTGSSITVPGNPYQQWLANQPAQVAADPWLAAQGGVALSPTQPGHGGQGQWLPSPTPTPTPTVTPTPSPTPTPTSTSPWVGPKMAPAPSGPTGPSKPSQGRQRV